MMYSTLSPPTSAHPVIVADRFGNLGVARYVRRIYDPKRNTSEEVEKWEVDKILEGRTLADPVKWLPMAQLARLLLGNERVLSPDPN